MLSSNLIYNLPATFIPKIVKQNNSSVCLKLRREAKLLAYIGLCRPHVGYAAVWDPNLEMVQHNDIDLFPDSKAETA